MRIFSIDARIGRIGALPLVKSHLSRRGDRECGNLAALSDELLTSSVQSAESAIATVSRRGTRIRALVLAGTGFLVDPNRRSHVGTPLISPAIYIGASTGSRDI